MRIRKQKFFEGHKEQTYPIKRNMRIKAKEICVYDYQSIHELSKNNNYILRKRKELK